MGPRLLSPPAWAWLRCHHALASACRCLPSLPRCRWPCGADGFKLLLVLLLVSAALAEVRFIASSSMAPTLRAGDRVVAEKITYLFRRPSVGDIVFFKVPTALQNYGLNKDVVFIKRILATPGDFIENPERMKQLISRISLGHSLKNVHCRTIVREGQLLINGVAQKEHYVPSHAPYTMEAMCLPEGHVFVMGDNRNNSCDSRAWGPLPIRNIIGRYMMSFTRS